MSLSCDMCGTFERKNKIIIKELVCVYKSDKLVENVFNLFI